MTPPTFDSILILIWGQRHQIWHQAKAKTLTLLSNADINFLRDTLSLSDILLFLFVK